MTEKIYDQISAFIDDELSGEESAFLVRRLERDAGAHSQAARYTLIGCALRGELHHPDHDLLRRRVQSALLGAAPSLASRPRPSRRLQYVRPVIGVGIAASVALAAVVGLRSLNQGSPSSPALSAAPAVVSSAAPTPVVAQQQWTEPPSYVVPQDVREGSGNQPMSPIRLTNYLVRHGEYASGLSRTSVHSAVVGAAETIDQTAEQPDEPVPQTVE
jgi:sigma-E factor negative regulatory protein RseA